MYALIVTDCTRTCLNGGILNEENCTCDCAGGFSGPSCTSECIVRRLTPVNTIAPSEAAGIPSYSTLRCTKGVCIAQVAHQGTAPWGVRHYVQCTQIGLMHNWGCMNSTVDRIVYVWTGMYLSILIDAPLFLEPAVEKTVRSWFSSTVYSLCRPWCYNMLCFLLEDDNLIPD